MKTLVYTGDCLTNDTLRAYHNRNHEEKSGINLHYNPKFNDDLKNIYEVSVDVLKNLDLKQSSLGKYLGWYRKWQIKRLIKSVSIKGTSKTKEYIRSNSQNKLATKVQNLVHKYMMDDKKYEFKITKFSIDHIEDSEQRAPIEIPQTTEQDETDYSSSPSSSIGISTPFGSVDSVKDNDTASETTKEDISKLKALFENAEIDELQPDFKKLEEAGRNLQQQSSKGTPSTLRETYDQSRSCISEESKWPKLKPQPEKLAFEESISFQAHLLRQK